MDRITDYASLVSGIQELVNLEVGDSVDVFIQLAESEVQRNLETLWQEQTEQVTPTAAGIFYDDTRRGILRISVDGRVLERLHPDVALSTYGDATPQQPYAYSVTGGTAAFPSQQHVQFWPEPPDGSTYTATISYKLVIPELSSSNTTNWLLLVAPDVYLYGSARHAVVYNGDDSSLAAYEQKFSLAMASVIKESGIHQTMHKSVSPPGAGGYEFGLP